MPSNMQLDGASESCASLRTTCAPFVWKRTCSSPRSSRLLEPPTAIDCCHADRARLDRDTAREACTIASISVNRTISRAPICASTYSCANTTARKKHTPLPRVRSPPPPRPLCVARAHGPSTEPRASSAYDDLVVDACWLQPPEPMEKVVALECLKPGQRMRFLIHREPYAAVPNAAAERLSRRRPTRRRHLRDRNLVCVIDQRYLGRGRHNVP